MYKDKKVIVVTPAGRRRYLEILIPYLCNQRDIVDEWHIWLNTKIEEDIVYIKRLKNDFIKVIEHPYDDEKSLQIEAEARTKYDPNGGCRNLPIFNIGKFLSLAPNDKNLIYVRIDDDICFIEENAISNLVKFRYDNPGYFLVYGNIINNLRLDYFHQNLCHKFIGLQPMKNAQEDYICYDWGAVIALHQEFISDLTSGKVQEYFFEDIELKNCEYTSIQCISYFANDVYDLYHSLSVPEIEWEENALCCTYPLKVGKINAICGNAIVCHFSNLFTREGLEKHSDLLDIYKELSLKMK